MPGARGVTHMEDPHRSTGTHAPSDGQRVPHGPVREAQLTEDPDKSTSTHAPYDDRRVPHGPARVATLTKREKEGAFWGERWVKPRCAMLRKRGKERAIGGEGCDAWEERERGGASGRESGRQRKRWKEELFGREKEGVFRGERGGKPRGVTLRKRGKEGALRVEGCNAWEERERGGALGRELGRQTKRWKEGRFGARFRKREKDGPRFGARF